MNDTRRIESRSAPSQPSNALAEMPWPSVDRNGDAIFRFALKPPAPLPASLDEFYRAQLHDLLRLVRLYVGTTEVLVDGFAFRSEPTRIQPVQPREPEER